MLLCDRMNVTCDMKVTLSAKNEEWKWTVLPEIEISFKFSSVSRLSTRTTPRRGIPTGLKNQNQMSEIQLTFYNG